MSFVEVEETELDVVSEEEADVVLFATPEKVGNEEVDKGVEVIEAKDSTVGNEEVIEEEDAVSADEVKSVVDAVSTADAGSTEDAVAGETDDMTVTASSAEYVVESGRLSMPKKAVALASTIVSVLLVLLVLVLLMLLLMPAASGSLSIPTVVGSAVTCVVVGSEVWVVALTVAPLESMY